MQTWLCAALVSLACFGTNIFSPIRAEAQETILKTQHAKINDVYYALRHLDQDDKNSLSRIPAHIFTSDLAAPAHGQFQEHWTRLLQRRIRELAPEQQQSLITLLEAYALDAKPHESHYFLPAKNAKEALKQEATFAFDRGLHKRYLEIAELIPELKNDARYLFIQREHNISQHRKPGRLSKSPLQIPTTSRDTLDRKTQLTIQSEILGHGIGINWNIRQKHLCAENSYGSIYWQIPLGRQEKVYLSNHFALLQQKNAYRLVHKSGKIIQIILPQRVTIIGLNDDYIYGIQEQSEETFRYHLALGKLEIIEVPEPILGAPLRDQQGNELWCGQKYIFLTQGTQTFFYRHQITDVHNLNARWIRYQGKLFLLTTHKNTKDTKLWYLEDFSLPQKAELAIIELINSRRYEEAFHTYNDLSDKDGIAENVIFSLFAGLAKNKSLPIDSILINLKTLSPEQQFLILHEYARDHLQKGSITLYKEQLFNLLTYDKSNDLSILNYAEDYTLPLGKDDDIQDAQSEWKHYFRFESLLKQKEIYPLINPPSLLNASLQAKPKHDLNIPQHNIPNYSIQCAGHEVEVHCTNNSGETLWKHTLHSKHYIFTGQLRYDGPILTCLLGNREILLLDSQSGVELRRFTDIGQRFIEQIYPLNTQQILLSKIGVPSAELLDKQKLITIALPGQHLFSWPEANSVLCVNNDDSTLLYLQNSHWIKIQADQELFTPLQNTETFQRNGTDLLFNGHSLQFEP